MIPHGEILADLARVKAIFQLRAIAAVIGIPPQVDQSPEGGDGLSGSIHAGHGPAEWQDAPNPSSSPTNQEGE